MLECKKCNGQYSYINGLFHCKSCKDYADTREEIEKFTLELYNCFHFSDINMDGKFSFLSGKSLENNPYKGENTDFSIMWEEGWKDGLDEHNNFVKIQQLEEENKKLRKNNKELINLINKIYISLFPFKGKFFRFGQNRVVNKIGKDLGNFIKEKKNKL